jgi:hypothetical protein
MFVLGREKGKRAKDSATQVEGNGRREVRWTHERSNSRPCKEGEERWIREDEKQGTARDRTAIGRADRSKKGS